MQLGLHPTDSSLHSPSKLSQRLPVNPDIALNLQDPKYITLDQVVDSDSLLYVKVPNTMNASSRFYLNSRMRPEWCRPEELEFVIDDPANSMWESFEFGLSSWIVLNRIVVQSLSLFRISAAGTPLTRPA